MYAVMPVVITVHDVALGVRSEVKLKKADFISTFDPAVITVAADVLMFESDIA